jgi:MATE family multidrug resistance protein
MTGWRLKRRVAHARGALFDGRAMGRRWWSRRFRQALRDVSILAWPIATAMGGETLMGLVDTKLVGGLGPAALGGVGVAMTLVWLGYMFIFGLMRGVKVCVSHAVGAGHRHHGLRYAQAGVVVGLGAGAAMWLLTRDGGPLLHLMGIDPALVPYARTFLSLYTYGAPASAVLSAMNHHRQATGDSRTPMAVGLAGNVINAVLGWALIYGHGGLPALGVAGAAVATAASETLEALAMVALLVRDARGSDEWARARRELSLRAAVREVTGLGVPTGVQFGSEMLAMVTFTAVLGAMPPEQIAAHQIALAAIRASFLPGVAVSEAVSVLVGQALGRRSLADADRATYAGLLLATSFMATCGIVFGVGGGAIARAFTTDPAVAGVARRLLWIAAGFQVLDATAIVLRGALRGAKDVRVPALIGVAVIWTCVPTAALVLGRMLHGGSAGGWFGFVGETSLGAVLFLRRWRHGAWRRAYAPPAPVTAPDREQTALVA